MIERTNTNAAIIAVPRTSLLWASFVMLLNVAGLRELLKQKKIMRPDRPSGCLSIVAGPTAADVRPDDRRRVLRRRLKYRLGEDGR